MRKMTLSGTNSPQTSSIGRLFDAIAALIGVKDVVNYEGQAAIELEALTDRECATSYEFDISEDGSVFRADPVIRGVVEDMLDGVSPGTVSAKFHFAVANLIASLARRVRDEYRLNRVALSGGVFQNMFLLQQTTHLLAREGFEVFTHSRVPPNDGGISLGQAAIANAQVASRRV
jgi:hydrogenase maturation protein HypF